MSILRLAVSLLLSLFKSRRRLVLDNLTLRQQATMLRQSVKKPRPSMADKLFWILFSRYVDGWREILYGLHPDNIVRWHRQDFRLYWRWKSRHHGPGEHFSTTTQIVWRRWTSSASPLPGFDCSLYSLCSALTVGKLCTSTPPNIRQPSGLHSSFLKPFPLILLRDIFYVIAMRSMAIR